MAHKKCLKKVTWCDCIKDDIEELKIARDTNTKLKKEIIRLKNWEKEFEDEINLGESTEGAIYPYLTRLMGFEDIFEKYLEIIVNGSPMKVKIKCKEGCIQIERIDENDKLFN